MTNVALLFVLANTKIPFPSRNILQKLKFLIYCPTIARLNRSWRSTCAPPTKRFISPNTTLHQAIGNCQTDHDNRNHTH